MLPALTESVQERYVPNPQNWGEGCKDFSDVVRDKEFLVRDPAEYIKRRLERKGVRFEGPEQFRFESSIAGYGDWILTAEIPAIQGKIEIRQRYMRNEDLPSGREVINLSVELEYPSNTPRTRVNSIKRVIVSTGLESLRI
jgi:hypothetical protein